MVDRKGYGLNGARVVLETSSHHTLPVYLVKSLAVTATPSLTDPPMNKSHEEGGFGVFGVSSGPMVLSIDSVDERSQLYHRLSI